MVLSDGEPSIYVERGGRSLLSFTDDHDALAAAADALSAAVREGWLGGLSVERTDGVGRARRRARGGAGRGRLPQQPEGPAAAGLSRVDPPRRGRGAEMALACPSCEEAAAEYVGMADDGRNEMQLHGVRPPLAPRRQAGVAPGGGPEAGAEGPPGARPVGGVPVDHLPDDHPADDGHDPVHRRLRPGRTPRSRGSPPSTTSPTRRCAASPPSRPPGPGPARGPTPTRRTSAGCTS